MAVYASLVFLCVLDFISNFTDFLAVVFSFVLPGSFLCLDMSMVWVCHQLVDESDKDDLVTEACKSIH